MPAKKNTLIDVLASVQDCRSRQGRRFELRHVLAASILAMLCGARTLRAQEAWMQANRSRLNHRFGFGWASSPKKSGLATTLAGADPAQLAAAIGRLAGPAGAGQLACDGKVARGSKENFLSVFDGDSLLALDRIPFAQGQEGEALREWLASGAAKGRLVTADAAHFQKKLSTRPRRAEPA